MIEERSGTHGSLHKLSLLRCSHDYSLRCLWVWAGVPGYRDIYFAVVGEVVRALDLGSLDLGEHHRFALFANIVPEYRVCVVAIVWSTTTSKQPAEAGKGEGAYSLGSISLSLVEAK